ncbi:hypothetical protein CC86DRAFT_168403 [Ophiobolus disseminans]|uniref:Uncharacterized protein n=1 Tax=Ophiobolus disseminans TaxID=1469910 RepID=A0A6A7ADT6_9PLEO|nr:hypothetical protein CC86DRAFT_168403 [Ophiobolus disseminans]
MVPSPRKRAPRPTFDQTWNETDTASLDPSSLPITRVPRAWERKQEIKRTEEGREKKIWRRFNLRSRATDTTEEQDEEEHDARARPVKKLQHLSPKAMEKTAAKFNGKKRTFKATRWDRRKSVLPRKKSTRSQDAPTEDQEAADDSDDTHDASAVDVTEVDPAVEPNMNPLQDLVSEGKSRRETFSFTMETEAETVDELLDHDSMSDLDNVTNAPEDTIQDEDATIVYLFRSPAKTADTQSLETPEEVDYPELPHSDREEPALEPVDMAEVADTTEGTGIMLEGADQADIVEEHVEIEDHQTTSQIIEVQEMEIESTSEVLYPALPAESLDIESVEPEVQVQDDHAQVTVEDAEMLETTSNTDADQEGQEAVEEGKDLILYDDEEESGDEEFTEASLQLNILRDYQDTLRGKQLTMTEASEDVEEDSDVQSNAGQISHVEAADEDDQYRQHQETPMQSSVKTHIEDITDGLTLSFTPAKAPSAEPTPQKLQSPPIFPVQSSPDATMSIALDDDTALLKDFLNRAAASKAEKAAVITHRRESLQNRRDSDVIRHALASPRKVLEEKDPNSPSKHDNELTLDLSQTLTLNMGLNALTSPSPDQADDEDTAEERSLRGSRRSSRAKKSRLPAPASAAPIPTQASKIAIRRADGTEHVVLKKSDAQELSALTRNNTRKNKQGAFGVTVRLMKLAMDAASLAPLDDSTKEPIVGKNIRWDEQLAYYQENPETVAEAESLATPDELGMPDPVSTPSAKPKSKLSKSSTPKIRRVRGLGTANGTPGKGLLAPSSLLPEDVQEEKEAAQAPAQQLPKPRASKIKKMTVASSTATAVSIPSDSKLPSLDIVPVGVEPTKERKSRLAAPKKVMLPQPTVTLPVEGKENPQRTGISGATPRKGIPAPKVMIPSTVGMESGLPRRRGRKI